MAFSSDELEAMRQADEEIEANFSITSAEISAARERDFYFSLAQDDERKANERRRKKAWYDANREKILNQKKRYYQENRETRLAYQNEYRKRRASSEHLR